MRTKIEAGKIATTAGTHMVIASGHVDHPLHAIDAGGRATWFLAARQSGDLAQEMDRGLARAQGHAHHRRRRRRGAAPRQKSAAGRRHSRRRHFGRGDAVVIRGPDGAEIGRGLVAYDAEDAAKIVRKSSGDIVLILGIEGRAEMVHRDDMVLGGA